MIDAALQAMGVAVVAFLWQGAVIGAVVALALRAVRAEDAQRRHDVALAGALACVVTFAGTLLVQLRTGSPASPIELLLPELATGAALEALLVAPEPASVPGWEVLSAWAWLLGCAFMALRGTAQWASARSIVRSASPPEARHWTLVLESVGERLGLRHAPRLLVSERLASPALIGWWRPAIVVPVAMLTRLSTAQVEAVLAHELAHLRRSDHAVNALLAIAEVLLFFHPVVWRLLREVRKQRELCTDQLALTVIDEPRLLAEALTNLEAQRLQTRAALPARPREGTLMQRIRTILTPTATRTSRPLGAATLALVALATGGLATSASAETPTTPVTSVITQEDDMASLQRRLRIAVERGLLTREEMKRVLDALRKVPAVRDQRPTDRGGKADERQRALRMRYAELEQRLQKAVATGKMSREDAEAKLAEARQEMFGGGEGQERQRALRMRYAELEQRLQKAVAAGELSREDAEAKLVEARKEMFGSESKQPAADRGDLRERRMRFGALQERLEKAVAAGEMSRKDADAKLEAAYTEMFGDRDAAKRAPAEAPSEGDLKRRYAQAEERVMKGIAMGKLTEEEGKARLEALRTEMFGDAKKKEAAPGRKGKVQEARRRFEEEARKIEAAIKAGKISAEDGKAKLEELQKQFDAPLKKSPSGEKKADKKSKSKSKAEEKPASRKSKAPAKKEKASQKDKAPKKKSKVGDSL